jgi:ubiquinone biosynthesis protein UbiJ
MAERTTDDGVQTIEAAFARAEADADAAIKAATSVLSTLKRYRNAARQGKIRDIRVAGDAARQGIGALDAQVAGLAESWSFDDEGYLQNGGYVAELIGQAERAGLRISELDGRLYCYPSLIRVLPGDRALSIRRRSGDCVPVSSSST